jgi:tetratricopeptide (TPR) repeat protein
MNRHFIARKKARHGVVTARMAVAILMVAAVAACVGYLAAHGTKQPAGSIPTQTTEQRISPLEDYTPEGRQNLHNAKVASGDKLHEAAIGYFQNVLRTDPGHSEIFCLLGDEYFNSGQRLSSAACYEAFLCLSPQAAVHPQRADILKAAVNVKNDAEVKYESLISMAKRGAADLPHGTDPVWVMWSPQRLAGPADLPYGADALRAKTYRALYSALVKRGKLASRDQALEFIIIYEKLEAVDGETAVPEMMARIDYLAAINDFEVLRLHYTDSEYRVAPGERGLLCNADEIMYRNKKIPEVLSMVSDLWSKTGSEPELLAAYGAPSFSTVSSAVHAKYKRAEDQLWSKYEQDHPIKPAGVDDWLAFISQRSDPTADIEPFLQQIRSVTNQTAPEVPSQLAVKAGEIGDYLWQLEELERRCDQKALSP